MIPVTISIQSRAGLFSLVSYYPKRGRRRTYSATWALLIALDLRVRQHVPLNIALLEAALTFRPRHVQHPARERFERRGGQPDTEAEGRLRDDVVCVSRGASGGRSTFLDGEG